MRDIIAKLRGWIFRSKCILFKKHIVIGRGLRIYRKLWVEGKGKLIIGSNCTIDGIKGDPSQYVSIDTHSSDAVIRIGNDVALYAARISSKYAITIGNGVVIEEAGVVDTDFHNINKGRGAPSNENAQKCRIEIGDGVHIGSRSVVMKGVQIGNDAMISPGAVVTMPVKPGSYVVGNPARVLPSRS